MLPASIRLPSESRSGLCGTSPATGGADATLRHVESKRALRVTLAGARSGEYVIVEEREHGFLVLAPDASMAAIRRRHEVTPATLAEFAAEYGPVQPPDGEGWRRRRGEGRRARPCVHRQPNVGDYCRKSSPNSASMCERRMERRRASANSRTSTARVTLASR